MSEIHANAIRRLTSDEAPELTAHLLRLDAHDRRMRFGRPIADARIARYVADIDWRRGGVIGFFDGGILRGSAQLAWPERSWPDGGEIGLTVEAAYRNHGIGGALMRRGIALARDLGLSELRLFALADNEPVKHLAHDFGFRLRHAGTEIEGRLPLPPPTAPSDAREFAAAHRP